jgi:hypothetical protein
MPLGVRSSCAASRLAATSLGLGVGAEAGVTHSSRSKTVPKPGVLHQICASLETGKYFVFNIGIHNLLACATLTR